MKSGRYKDYYWLVSSKTLWSLEKLVVSNHKNLTLAITSFDSGPLKPTEKEKQLGINSFRFFDSNSTKVLGTNREN